MFRGLCRRWAILLIFAGWVLSPSRVALAQAGRGEVSGEVRDPTGAVIPAARVVVIEVQTSQVAETRTSRGGTYTIQNLNATMTVAILPTLLLFAWVQRRF